MCGFYWATLYSVNGQVITEICCCYCFSFFYRCLCFSAFFYRTSVATSTISRQSSPRLVFRQPDRRVATLFALPLNSPQFGFITEMACFAENRRPNNNNDKDSNESITLESTSQYM